MKKLKQIFKKFKIKENSPAQYGAYFFLGAVAAMGFAPFNLWWATTIGVGGAYYLTVRATDSARCARFVPSVLRVFPFSAAYALGMFWWVVNSIYVVPELASQFAIWTVPALLGIGLLGGIVFAIPFVLMRCVRLNPAARPFLFAGAWTVILWLREWLLTGFPWNPIANILMPFPVIANSMSLWGALGLTFVIVGLISSIMEITKNRKEKNISVPLVIFVTLMVVGMFFGYKNIQNSQIENYDALPIVRIVQPARSAVDKASHSREQAMANAEKNISRLVELAKKDNEKIDLIVFPETTYPFLVANDEIPFVKTLGAKTIMGAISYDGNNFYNSLLISNMDGNIEKIYSKSHLVPFGEYRPFGDIIPTPGQWTRGAGAEVINLNLGDKTLHFAPAICYEVIFTDSLVPKNSDVLPDMIINITNDTWFGKTPGTYQHLDMVRRYAIESGLPIVRANYSGISAFVSADGGIVSLLPIGEAGAADGIVGGGHMTIYRIVGRDLSMLVILMFSIICAISISGFRKKD